MPKVNASRHRSEGTARCVDCDALRADSTRGRARQHVVNTGHTVRFVIEDTTVYTRKATS